MTDDVSRRTFLKRMAVIAFAAPVVTTFALDALAESAPKSGYGNQFYPNQQGRPNPGQFFGNQGAPKTYFANQHFPNQYSPSNK